MSVAFPVLDLDAELRCVYPPKALVHVLGVPSWDPRMLVRLSLSLARSFSRLSGSLALRRGDVLPFLCFTFGRWTVLQCVAIMNAVATGILVHVSWSTCANVPRVFGGRGAGSLSVC